MKHIKSILFLLFAVICSHTIAGNKIDLSGVWSVALDSTDIGLQNGWYKNRFPDSIVLPGTTDDARLGVANRLLPKLEKPQMLHLTRKNSYCGVAWYTREISIPKNMDNRPLALLFERVLWKSQLWIDGKEVGDANESLTTPHRYSLPEGLSAGKHTITLRIDNRKRYDISVKDLAHAYTNDTQIMWNGVLGRMELEAKDDVSVEQVDVYPDLTNRTIKIVVGLTNWTRKEKQVALNLQVLRTTKDEPFKKQAIKATVKNGRQTVEACYAMGDEVVFWDEFNPEMYKLNVTCKSGKQTSEKEATFGMRQISANKSSLEVNGNRVFLRGTLECCIFPLTGTPPMTEKGWEKVFRVAKEWGLNHLRFHSWCPPQAAFTVADKMGFYLQVELPNWSLTVGKDEHTNAFLYHEFDRIIAEYGNHPSFCLFSTGNELQPDFAFLNAMVQYMKSKDSRHLYTTTTFTFEKGHGGKPEPEDDFFVTQWTDNGWIRGQGIFDQEAPNFSKDYSAASKGIHVPLISHEIGQYAVYPNLKEIEKYTGVLDPLNFKAVRNDLEKKNLVSKADDFLKASGKLAVLLYKEEIERAMKTAEFSGFQLLDLHDFPGQGTALVGLLDAFWDSKGLTDPSFFRQFCAPVVPLARFPQAVYSGNDNFEASVEIANYSNADLQGKKVIWKLQDGRSLPIMQGVLNANLISKGGVSKIGFIKADLKKIAKACKLNLEISIEGTNWKNSWCIWVYPELKTLNFGDVVVTAHVNEALKALGKGKKVLLSPSVGELKGLEGKFLPVFWSPIHFPKQAGTMGLLCDSSHPAFANFPTDMHSDWQWWNLVKKSKVLIVDSLQNIDPIVESVDNFANNRRLASIFEAKCGNGRLMMSAMDLLSDQGNVPEIKQMLYSLVEYMKSEQFAPSSQVSEQEIRSLFLEEKGKTEAMDATSIYQE